MFAQLGIPAAAVWWIVLFSAIMLGLALITVPIVVSRLPSDYFIRTHRSAWMKRSRLGWICWPVLVIKNLIGLGFLFFGILMLVLPGQGLLTILIAAMLLDYPGKYRLQRWVVRRKGVSNSINWMRRKAGRPPFEFEDDRPIRTEAT